MLIAVAVGCGGPSSTVSGVLLLDGEPVQATGMVIGTVMLEPSTDTGVPATGSVNGDGRFEVTTGANRGLEPGKYAVAVNVLRSMPPAYKGAPPGAERISHPKYASTQTSGISFEVSPGSNDFELEIESAPKR